MNLGTAGRLPPQDCPKESAVPDVLEGQMTIELVRWGYLENKEDGHFKFYRILWVRRLAQNGPGIYEHFLITHWGRIGTKGQSSLVHACKDNRTNPLFNRIFNEKYREKESRDYCPIPDKWSKVAVSNLVEQVIRLNHDIPNETNSGPAWLNESVPGGIQ